MKKPLTNSAAENREPQLRVVVLRKRPRDRSIRINITINPALAPVLDRIIAEKCFKGPVDYFESRIRLDGHLTLKLDEQAAA